MAPDVGAPAKARRLLERSFGATLEPTELDRAKLIVTELVTNGVRHGGGYIAVHAALSAGSLVVDVVDQGPGFEPGVPEPRFDEVGGWGLSLVAAEASRWGLTKPPTRVWFEIERSATAVRSQL
jgi:anti-sigma regulatory factor (Ser/Thr protein kinase)